MSRRSRPPPGARKIDPLLAALRSSKVDAVRREFSRLGPRALALVHAGLEDPEWRVRRDCLRILDHMTDAESGRRVAACLDDEHPEVRKWAAHALGCDRCKGGGRDGFDAVPALIEVIRNDPSLVVRRSAVVALAWNQPPDDRIAALLEALLAEDDDEKIRLHAEGGAERHRSAC